MIQQIPINIFCNNFSPHNNDNKIDTSLFLQKPYLRFIYIESNVEEDIDLKNQYRTKNLSDTISRREAASKNYVDEKCRDHSIIKTPLMLILMIKISILCTLSK